MAQGIILETHGPTKGFKGFTAVFDANPCVQRGSIHTLIGPNGVGRTTCFNLLTRLLMPARGTILFNGVDIIPERPVQIARRDVIRSFQISTVLPHLAVMENVRVGLQRQPGTVHAFQRSEQSLNTLDTRTIELLEQAGLTEFARTMTVELSYDRERALGIATMLAMKPELMLLGEPTQGMGHEDVNRMTELIKRIVQGRTILMVKHNMSVVSPIADKITVLQHGQTLTENPYGGISKSPQVMEAYMGTADAALEGH